MGRKGQEGPFSKQMIAGACFPLKSTAGSDGPAHLQGSNPGDNKITHQRVGVPTSASGDHGGVPPQCFPSVGKAPAIHSGEEKLPKSIVTGFLYKL